MAANLLLIKELLKVITTVAKEVLQSNFVDRHETDTALHRSTSLQLNFVTLF